MSDLSKPYEPALIYYPDADAVEYVTRDAAVLYEEIGPGAAIVRDMTTNEIVGFRISEPKAWGAFVSAQ